MKGTGPQWRPNRAGQSDPLSWPGKQEIDYDDRDRRHGLYAVSNRQVSEAAGQGNNAAVGYHFGTKTDLVRAIVNKHAGQIEQHRSEMLKDADGSTNVRVWVTCLVRPSTEHLAALGIPSWYARFNAQVVTDPTLRVLAYTEATAASPTLEIAEHGLEGTSSWDDFATDLIDAIVGLWTAPVTRST